MSTSELRASPPPRRRRALAIGVAFVIIVFLITAAWKFREIRARNDVLHFARRITGLRIETGTPTYVFDNAETHVEMRLPIGSAEIATLEAEHRARRIAALPGHGFVPYFSGFESPADSPPPLRAGMLWMHGCNGSDPWYGLIDPAQGMLWLVIFYPDPGGDSLGCNDLAPFIRVE